MILCCEVKMAPKDGCYALVLNIPPSFHTCDLRSFFSDFVETERFGCFHFRHRPQQELVNLSVGEIKASSTVAGQVPPRQLRNYLVEKPVCCILSCQDDDSRNQIIKKYHFQHWVNSRDETLDSRCVVVSVKVNSDPAVLPVPSLAVQPKILTVEVSQEKLETLFELRPPGLMPRGNVGTPTKHFLGLIKNCQLPSKLIAKLGLNFPKSRTRKYGSVPFEYDSSNHRSSRNPREEEHSPGLNAGREQSEAADKKTGKPDIEEEEEEWDRHEALHDDVTEQDRTKERLYEEEMEVVWEKGGPGIVWYTDAQLWKEAEGDFDEQTTDDWDVDYSVYFEENGGDMDARDAVEMRRSTMRRQGDLQESVFKKPHSARSGGKRPSSTSFKKRVDVVGPFEQHTRGIGRRLMERAGWRDGAGLGRTMKGISKPIENDGQKPKERKGLGYFGEQLPRFSSSSRKKPTDVLIATVYDNPAETDPPEPLYQRNQPTAMKHRS